MGSRMMHYCISSIINKRLDLGAPFLLGGIAPDVHKHMNEPKEASHFARRNEAGNVYTDYEAFAFKYFVERQCRTPFHFGYYAHLISDDCWLTEIYVPKVKRAGATGLEGAMAPDEAKKQAQAKCYRDFWRLNGKLADHYGFRWQPLPVEPVDIDEIDYSYLPLLAEDMARDFRLLDEAKREELELLDFGGVVDLLERSAAKCLEELERYAV